VDVTGLADAELVAAIGREFGLHALSLEDVFDPLQRAKVEHFDDHTFVVLKTLATTEPVSSRQLSLFFGERFVITMGDAPHPAFEPVRQRLAHGRGRIRSGGADYLAYALIDTVIDHYFPVVEAFDDRLERVEDAILEARNVDPIGLTRRARHDLRTIRHAIWPAREVVTSLIHEDIAHLSDETRLHLRDCYDHLIQLQEMVEASREIAANLLEAYVSAVSLRTNEVMKILTIIATIFIPLTFITGLYGMNFDPGSSPFNKPELGWYWGYPFALSLMLSTAIGSLLYFRKKGWFGGRRRR
jgi:magnesium transporter